jgi:hypothetical protein
MLSRLVIVTLVLFSAVVSHAADDPSTPILGVWEYRQANSASPSGFDDEGERLQFTRTGSEIQGMYFGLEREGEHGLFYSLVALKNIQLTGNKISFTVPERGLYSTRPTRIGEALESAGYTKDELHFEGAIEEGALSLRCSSTFASCPDSRVVFRKGAWKK